MKHLKKRGLYNMKRTNLKTLGCIVLSTILVSSAVSAYPGTVVTDLLNVRTAASLDADVVDQLTYGDVVDITYDSGDGWFEIYYNGSCYYVSSDCVSEGADFDSSYVGDAYDEYDDAYGYGDDYYDDEDGWDGDDSYYDDYDEDNYGDYDEDYYDEDDEDYDEDDEDGSSDYVDEEDYDADDQDDEDDSSDADDYDEESYDDEDSEEDASSDEDSESDEEDEDEDPGQDGGSDEVSASGGTYLGNFTLTGYCNCASCCGTAGNPTASGVMPSSGHTVAMGGVDFGTQLLINGTVYTVEDRGTPYGHVDIFFDSHEAALAFGMQSADVYQLN